MAKTIENINFLFMFDRMKDYLFILRIITRESNRGIL